MGSSRPTGRSFHSTKEGFKARGRPEVRAVAPSFHSTKEGFKGRYGARRDLQADAVSIPPRKVSRDIEVIKDRTLSTWFPFHQGRFQGGIEQARSENISLVSIPPRKVSREDGQLRQRLGATAFPFHQGRFQGRLGSSVSPVK